MAFLGSMVNISKLLAAQTAAINAAVGNDGISTRNQLTASNNAVDARLDAITAANGQIATDVLAINEHTTTQLGELSTSAIKSIQRGTTYMTTNSSEGAISIAAVNTSKTVVNNLGGRGRLFNEKNARTGIYLKNETTLQWEKEDHENHQYIHWEVIEYV